MTRNWHRLVIQAPAWIPTDAQAYRRPKFVSVFTTAKPSDGNMKHFATMTRNTSTTMSRTSHTKDIPQHCIAAECGRYSQTSAKHMTRTCRHMQNTFQHMPSYMESCHLHDWHQLTENLLKITSISVIIGRILSQYFWVDSCSWDSTRRKL